MKTRSLPITLSLVGILLCWTGFAFASGPTNVSGIISQSTTWTVADSPYVVTGNVLVSAGVTLTLEPGTRVTFQQDKFLQVDGTLIADGNASAVIVFTSAQSTPAADDWGPLKFTKSSVGATLSGTDYVSGSVFRYTRIEYGRGVSLVDAFPYFSNNIFYKNIGPIAAFQCGQGSASRAVLHWMGLEFVNGTLVVKNNVFDQNSSSGFQATPVAGGVKSFHVVSNQFLNNLGTAVMICSSANDDEISSNFISGNQSGILLGQVAGATTIADNTIMGSSRPAGFGGIAIDIYSGSPVIRNNLISDNIYIGGCSTFCSVLRVHNGGHPTVQNNTFWNNYAQALIFFNYAGGGGTFAGNNFQYNPAEYIFRHPTDNVNATGNYWGTADTAVIDSLIYDFNDDFTSGTVSYTPILSAPNPAAPAPRRRRGQSISH